MIIIKCIIVSIIVFSANFLLNVNKSYKIYLENINKRKKQLEDKYRNIENVQKIISELDKDLYERK